MAKRTQTPTMIKLLKISDGCIYASEVCGVHNYVMKNELNRIEKRRAKANDPR